jgi:hypothetical protein
LLVSSDDDDEGNAGLYLPLLHPHSKWFSKKLLAVAWQGKSHSHYVGVVPIKPDGTAAAPSVRLTRACLPTAHGTVAVRGLVEFGGAAVWGPLPGADAEARLRECFGETWQDGEGYLEVGGEQEKDFSKLLSVRECVGCQQGDLQTGTTRGSS